MCGWCRFPNSPVVTTGKSLYGNRRGPLSGDIRWGPCQGIGSCTKWVLFFLHPKISLPGHMTSGLTILVLILYAQSLQSCPVFFNPLDWSPPGSSVCGILQARILEWWPCLPPGDLPNPGIKPTSLVSPALAGGFFTPSATWEA